VGQSQKFDVVVVGAGIAGIAACHALVNAGASRVALVDSGAPLALTSDKSTECYRNFWPGPDDAMATLMNESIARLQSLTDASNNYFQLRQHGYLFATARQQELDALAARAIENENYGGGKLRHHNPGSTNASYRASPLSGYDASLDGADLITNRDVIRKHFPFLTNDTAGVLHVRKCGSLSAQQLGMYLLEQARDAGAEILPGEFTGIETSAGKLSAVKISTAKGSIELDSDTLVLATGPHLRSTAQLAGSQLPVMVEKHVKMTMPDIHAAIPRDAPLMIWNDPVHLHWAEEETRMLAASAETAHLTKPFPAGVHGRPVGAGNQIFLYWTFDSHITESPVFPIEPDPVYPEILLRGMVRMIPGLISYLDPMPKPFLDGGFYTKAADNRPLIGPLSVPGTFACGAFSGYGIMASCAAGELLAKHVLGLELPSCASAFDWRRFSDKPFLTNNGGLNASGQI